MSKLAQQMSKQIQPGMKIAQKSPSKTPVANCKCGGQAKAPVKAKKGK